MTGLGSLWRLLNDIVHWPLTALQEKQANMGAKMDRLFSEIQ